MKKTIIAIIICTVCCLSILGCGSGKKDSDLNDKLSKIKESSDLKEDSGTDTAEAEAPAKDELIDYSYRNNPMSLTDPANDGELIKGNYFTVALDSEGGSKYAKLSDAIDAWNTVEENSLKDEMMSKQVDVIGIYSAGFDGDCEIYKEFYPVRADSYAFSFALLEYSFLGGAHGFTQYYAYNFDPGTGNKISFSNVVKDTAALPAVIVDELEKQNSDLKDYFKECPDDRENLLTDIPERLKDDAAGLVWALDYDGIRIYFEDYAMGSHAAGDQKVKISFADYPDIFTDTYDSYKDRDKPDIDKQAKKDADAEKTSVKATESMWDYNEGDYEDEADEPFFGLWIGAFSERQKALDIVDDLREKGIEAYSIYSLEYENLSDDPYWCVTLGKSGSEPEAQAYIDDANKLGYKDAYVKYSGERLSHRVYYYMYSTTGVDITSSKITLDEIPIEELSGTAESEGPMTLLIDKDTVFDKTCDVQSFNGYKNGESPLEWFNHASGEDILGVFEVGITGNHVDCFYGSYWWD